LVVPFKELNTKVLKIVGELEVQIGRPVIRLDVWKYLKQKETVPVADYDLMICLQEMVRNDELLSN